MRKGLRMRILVGAVVLGVICLLSAFMMKDSEGGCGGCMGCGGCNKSAGCSKKEKV